MKFCTALAAAALAIPAAAIVPGVAFAQSSEEDAAAKIINDPRPDNFQVFGLKQAPRVRKDASVQEGKALRIDLPGGSGDPWRIGLNIPVQAAVKAGDNIVIYYWARLEKPEEGKTSARIAAAQLQLSAAPYTAIFSGSADVGSEWTLFQAKGKADKDYAKGALWIGFHLNTGKHIIDIGPVAAMNMGQ